MGVDHGEERGDKSPQNLERGGLSSQILSCCKILSTRLLALQCRKMFLPIQQDFYSKSRHASLQNSSQIYAYAKESTFIQKWITF